jgi:hypothetical protein
LDHMETTLEAELLKASSTEGKKQKEKWIQLTTLRYVEGGHKLPFLWDIPRLIDVDETTRWQEILKQLEYRYFGEETATNRDWR